MTPSPSTPPLAAHMPPGPFGAQIGGLGHALCPDLVPDPSLPALTTTTVDALLSSSVEITQTWFLATCHRCHEGLSEPFRDVIERDEWALKHAEHSGHLVHLGVDGMGDSLHQSVMLRYFKHGDMWRWACPAYACASLPDKSIRWYGPYRTGQLALAAWRAHEATR